VNRACHCANSHGRGVIAAAADDRQEVRREKTKGRSRASPAAPTKTTHLSERRSKSRFSRIPPPSLAIADGVAGIPRLREVWMRAIAESLAEEPFDTQASCATALRVLESFQSTPCQKTPEVERTSADLAGPIRSNLHQRRRDHFSEMPIDSFAERSSYRVPHVYGPISRDKVAVSRIWKAALFFRLK